MKKMWKTKLAQDQKRRREQWREKLQRKRKKRYTEKQKIKKETTMIYVLIEKFCSIHECKLSRAGKFYKMQCIKHCSCFWSKLTRKKTDSICQGNPCPTGISTSSFQETSTQLWCAQLKTLSDHPKPAFFKIFTSHAEIKTKLAVSEST